MTVLDKTRHALYRLLMPLSAIALAALTTNAYASEFNGHAQRPGARIIGGSITASGDWPSVVALLRSSSGSSSSAFDRQYCGGTLIAPTWVLTATHCLLDRQGLDMAPSDLSIVAGQVNLDAVSEENETPVLNIISRNDFQPGNNNNDIALLELSEPIAAPVVSLFAGEVDALTQIPAFVIGWGANNASNPQNLLFDEDQRAASVPIVDRETCNAPASNDGSVTDAQFCAGLADGGVDTCQGDSGGPLIIDINGDQVQVGITSRGVGCALPGRYGVYTDVADYIGWISQFVDPLVVDQLPPDDSDSNPPNEEADEADAADEELPDESDPGTNTAEETGADEEGPDEAAATDEDSEEGSTGDEGSDEDVSDEGDSDDAESDQENSESGSEEAGSGGADPDEGVPDQEGSEDGDSDGASDQQGSEDGDSDGESDQQGSEQETSDAEGSAEEAAEEDGADEEATDEGTTDTETTSGETGAVGTVDEQAPVQQASGESASDEGSEGGPEEAADGEADDEQASGDEALDGEGSVDDTLDADGAAEDADDEATSDEEPVNEQAAEDEAVVGVDAPDGGSGPTAEAGQPVADDDQVSTGAPTAEGGEPQGPGAALLDGPLGTTPSGDVGSVSSSRSGSGSLGIGLVLAMLTLSLARIARREAQA